MQGKPLKTLLITKNNFCVKTTIQTANRSSTDLTDDLVKEITRVKELLNVYNSLPNNVGVIASQRLKIHLAHAEKAMRDNDIIQMLQMYRILEECQ
jgi:GTP1/Obg family GTP-binding protein